MNVLGIDPGTVSGWALWTTRTGTLLECEGRPFLDAVFEIIDLHDAQGIDVAVVESNPDTGLYHKYGDANRRQRDAIARSVGHTDFAAKQFVLLMERLGVPCVEREPQGAKWTARELAQRAGYAHKTNNHGRDAARLVVGMRDGNVRLMMAEAEARSRADT